MAGTQTLGLQSPLQIGLRRECGKHLIATVAIHHMDSGRLQGTRGSQHMSEQWAPGERHQYLGALRFHPRTGAGGKDEDM